MTPVLTRHAPEPVRSVRRVIVPVVVVVALVTAAALMLRAVAPPSTVDELVVTNPSREQLTITVRPSDDSRVLFVATVEPRSETRVSDVLDQGDTWVVRAQRAGETVGDLRLSRRQLEARGWRVAIPSTWGERPSTGA